MNYTENYHLPQWDESDRVLRTDFNQMCLDMEAGLKQTVAGAEAGDAVVAAAAQKAQSTANQAVADAAKAQAKADAAYSPDQPPYAVGSYTGNGGELAVEVGFRPRFLLITGGSSKDYFIAAGAAGIYSTHLTLTDTGFTVKKYVTDTGFTVPVIQEVAPYLSTENWKYSYIAFR